MSKPPLTRRAFLAESAAAATAIALAPANAQAAEKSRAFQSDWQNCHDRVWIGPAYWANPLQDWRIAAGRLESVKAAPGRNVHALTRDLRSTPGTLTMSVRLGHLDAESIAQGKGSAGFSIGVKGTLPDYRHHLVHGRGFNVGLRAKGELFIGDGAAGKTAPVDLKTGAVELRVIAEPSGKTYRVTLSAHDIESGAVLGTVERNDVPADFLVGNLALVANFGAPQAGGGPRQQNRPAAPAGRWWFSDWKISGTKVAAHEARTFGPILFNQYTVHGGTLKMTVQMPPLGALDDKKVYLEVNRGNTWQTVGECEIEPVARIANFRVHPWNGDVEVPYQITYTTRFKNGLASKNTLHGVVRADPGAAQVLTVADISCNAHYAFPNTACAEAINKLNPDLIAFTGDQYYESSGGFGVERTTVENSVLDVLRKWMLHGWTWREITVNRPTVCIPDDHDVYHGNLWGEGGDATDPGQAGEAKGGYKMFAEFVNAVHRMQTSHHPDSPAKPGKQGITGYYGPLTYGGVSFAILADRQYKSGPAGKVPPTTSGRPDHVNDPAFDPKTADLPNLDLLGKAQMDFLSNWAKDWKGADMKAVISQTLFTAMATHHGKPEGLLVADYDTNAWPQSARNAAVREMRRAFAFHIAGDQHLPAVVHYGVDSHRDGVAAFASPAVNNLYPRWFRPEGEKTTGDFRDSFGHPLTVVACANPRQEFRKGVLEVETDKSSGYGVVRFDKKQRTITVECWPLLADPTKPGTQFPGWPVVVPQLENYARSVAAHLPELTIRGTDRPVLQVIDERTGESLYSLRLSGTTWRPHVFAEGRYTIRITEPETGKTTERTNLSAIKENTAKLEISV